MGPLAMLIPGVAMYLHAIFIILVIFSTSTVRLLAQGSLRLRLLPSGSRHRYPGAVTYDAMNGISVFECFLSLIRIWIFANTDPN